MTVFNPPAAQDYTLMGLQPSNTNPANATTYYFGWGGGTLSTVAARQKIVIPRAGTIVRVDIVVMVGSTLGTTETATFSIRLNDTTDTTISSSVKHDAAYQQYSAAVSIAVVANDFVEIKMAMPTWVTSPTNCRYICSIYIQ